MDHGNGQPSTCRITRHDYLAGRTAALKQSAIRVDGIVDCSWKRMHWRKTIRGRCRDGSCAGNEASYVLSVGPRVTEGISASVKVEDHRRVLRMPDSIEVIPEAVAQKLGSHAHDSAKR
jgi:hypothetical protein